MGGWIGWMEGWMECLSQVIGFLRAPSVLIQTAQQKQIDLMMDETDRSYDGLTNIFDVASA